MGNSVSQSELLYSLGVKETAEAGFSDIRRTPSHPDGLVKKLKDHKMENTWDCFKRGMSVTKTKRFLGTRVRLGDGGFGQYTWLSYTETEQRVLNLGSGLEVLGCVPFADFPEEAYQQAQAMKCVGIFSKNRAEWIITELAAAAFGYTIIPLYDTLGKDALSFILQQTRMQCIVVSGECVDSLISVCGTTAVKHAITLDDLTEAQKASLEALGLTIITWDKVLSAGEKSPRVPSPPGYDAVNTICYTSGTTANPKGVILTHGNLCSTIAGAVRGPVGTCELKFSPHDIHMSYLPLAHVLERIFSLYTIFSGAHIGFYSGESLRILEDLKELRPTFFVSVPRLYYRINDRINQRSKSLSGMLQALFAQGLNTKMKNLHRTGNPTHAFWDRSIFSKTRALLGGRCRFIACGGAPINPNILARMSCFFCVPACNGYGMSETTGCSFMSRPGDHMIGHIGGCVPSIEFRLKSLPSMGYDASGNPPEGELCIRGYSVTKGYFMEPELTAAAIDKDGWICSGDVVRVEAAGRVRVIDRAKSMFKLSQGEYVSPERIEFMYVQCPLVGQIFVHGESNKNHVVAIVAVEQDNAEKWAKANKLDAVPFEEFIHTSKFHAAIVAEMALVDAQLKGFERISKKFHLSHLAFTIENGFMTPTMKLRRANLKTHFAPEIEKMYA